MEGDYAESKGSTIGAITTKPAPGFTKCGLFSRKLEKTLMASGP